MNTDDWRIICYRKVRSRSVNIEGRTEWELDDWDDAQAYYEEQKLRFHGNIRVLQLGLTDGEETIVLQEFFP